MTHAKVERQALVGGAVIAAISSAILTWLALRQFVGFDSFWHVFVARQETWSAFWREILQNTHPPFFHLLLKASSAVFGPTVLAYRAVSIAGIAVATMFLALAVGRITGNAPLAVVAAAAFGLSANALEIGIEIRSYGVFLASVAVATTAWFDWLATMPRPTRPTTRVLFAGAISVSLLSHYSGFFVLGAMLAAPAVLYVIHRRWRVKLLREFAQRRFALGAMLGTPLLVAVAVYVLVLHRYENGLAHVAGFMYVPGAESRWTFVLRNGRNLLQIFAPSFGIPSQISIALWAIIGLAIGGISVRRLRMGRLDGVPFLVLFLLLLANVVAAFAGRYPFGGNSRHELFLFPFAILTLFAGLEAARRMMPSRFSSNGLWTVGSALPVLASAFITLSSFPVLGEEPAWRAQMDRFRSDFPSPPAVLVDQFNLIMFFGHHHDWHWHLRWEGIGQPMWQVWEVSRGDEHFSVCRAFEWELDFSKPATYALVRDCLAQSGKDSVAVFRTQAEGTAPVVQVQTIARALAQQSGLTLQSIDVVGNDVYAAFRAVGAREQPPGGPGTNPPDK